MIITGCEVSLDGDEILDQIKSEYCTQELLDLLNLELDDILYVHPIEDLMQKAFENGDEDQIKSFVEFNNIMDGKEPVTNQLKKAMEAGDIHSKRLLMNSIKRVCECNGITMLFDMDLTWEA